MKHVVMLVKMNIKLLLRNKGFIVAVLLLPLAAVLLLNLDLGADEADIDNAGETINELVHIDSQVAYLADNTRYSVKVFDSSGSTASDSLLTKLAEMGLFEIYRYHSGQMSAAEILKQAKDDAVYDRIGTILYIDADFADHLFQDKAADSLTIYRTAEDERQELFEDSLQILIAQMQVETDTLEYPVKHIEEVEDSSSQELDLQQSNAQSNVGYTFALLGLAFSLCGVLISHTIMEERENSVFTRVTLSNTTRKEYLGAKLVVAFLTTVLQTIVIGISMPLLIKADIGVRYVDYLLMVFLLGMVCTIFCMCVGAIAGDIMSANYTVIMLWTISSLVAGLYFPNDLTGMLGIVSRLTPQKWFFDISKMLLLGESGAYLMMASVTAAFLAVSLSVGAVGLRLKDEV
ncbi:MAG: ABC transporter permease [Lachnospiraceae bacterium]